MKKLYLIALIFLAGCGGYGSHHHYMISQDHDQQTQESTR